MSAHYAAVRWTNHGPDFLKRRYSREHTLEFDGGAVVTASSSPHVVPLPWSNPFGVDPEEGLIASVASCHMLWFLDVAISAGFEVQSYADKAEGLMTRNEQGRLWVSVITLHPQITWSGEKQPTAQEVAHLHHLAHEECFIANSIKSEVRVEAV